VILQSVWRLAAEPVTWGSVRYKGRSLRTASISWRTATDIASVIVTKIVLDVLFVFIRHCSYLRHLYYDYDTVFCCLGQPFSRPATDNVSVSHSMIICGILLVAVVTVTRRTLPVTFRLVMFYYI
jgi:thiamine transporter ThiT